MGKQSFLLGCDQDKTAEQRGIADFVVLVFTICVIIGVDPGAYGHQEGQIAA